MGVSYLGCTVYCIVCEFVCLYFASYHLSCDILSLVFDISTVCLLVGRLMNGLVCYCANCKFVRISYPLLQ